MLLLLVTLTAAVAAADNPLVELDKLEGTWTLVAVEENGQAQKPQAGASLVVKGGKFTATLGKNTVTGTLYLDGAAKPRPMDFVAADGTKLIIAAYVLDGDTLTVCWAADEKRPKAVAGGKGVTLATYKRKQ